MEYYLYSLRVDVESMRMFSPPTMPFDPKEHVKINDYRKLIADEDPHVLAKKVIRFEDVALPGIFLKVRKVQPTEREHAATQTRVRVPSGAPHALDLGVPRVRVYHMRLIWVAAWKLFHDS